MRSRVKLIMLTTAMLLISGCSGLLVRSTSPEDNPQHHYLSGMSGLENGKLALAQEKLERAIYLAG